MTNFTLSKSAAELRTTVSGIVYRGTNVEHASLCNILKTTAELLTKNHIEMSESQQQMILLGALIAVKKTISGEYYAFSPSGSFAQSGSELYQTIASLPVMTQLKAADDKIVTHDFALKSFQAWFTANRAAMTPVRRRENIYTGEDPDFPAVENALCGMMVDKKVKEATAFEHVFPEDIAPFVAAIKSVEYEGRWSTFLERLQGFADYVQGQDMSAEAKHQIILGAVIFTMTQINGGSPSLTATSNSRLFNSLKDIEVCKTAAAHEKADDVAGMSVRCFYYFYVKECFAGVFVDVALAHAIPVKDFDKNAKVVKGFEGVLTGQTKESVVQEIQEGAYAKIDEHGEHQVAAACEDTVVVDQDALAAKEESLETSVVTKAFSAVSGYFSMWGGSKPAAKEKELDVTTTQKPKGNEDVDGAAPSF